MSNTKYIPRLNVEIRPDQLSDLQNLLDHGMKKMIFNVLVDDVIRLLKKDKAAFIGGIITRQINYADILKTKVE